MNKIVNIFRIVTCISVSLYTALACWLCGKTAYYACYRMVPVGDGAHDLATVGITREAVPYIVVGVAVLLLGVASIVLLFRRGRLSACLSGGAAVACALLGMCIDTMLAETMLARYTLGITDLEAGLCVKPVAAWLCILTAVVYTVLRLIEHSIRSKIK